MANLAQLEKLFWRAVRSDRPLAELDGAFVGSDELSAARRVGIYRSAYWSRQERVLVETFPAVRAVQGDERFRRLAWAYLKQHPSEHFAIERVGRHFPEFLTEHGELSAYVSDLARLEWARLEVLLAPASNPLKVDALLGVDFAAARARLCASVRLLQQFSPAALRVWRDRVAPEAVEGEEREGCLVWRHGYHVRHRPLAPVERSALELLGAGHDFARVCSVFAGPGAAEAATRCIGRWFRDGVLCAFETGQGTGQPGPLGRAR
jgi:hypothetical protein